MAFSRYSRTTKLNLGAQHGTSQAIVIIRSAIKNGEIGYKQMILRGAERLDTLAGSIYGDSRYWWVLAAASDIGWGMQVPPGTTITIPDIGAVAQLVS
jgi:nucleoid-associated protein YgaU